MHGRGNKRPGLVAKILLALILAAGVGAVVIGIDLFEDEPPTVPGGRIAPGGAVPPPGSF